MRSRFGLESLLEAAQATRDAARDRPRRDCELVCDGLVALIAREEAIQHVLAGRRESGERLPDDERLLHLGQIGALLGCERLLVHRGLATSARDRVETAPPRELSDPRSERVVVPEG